MFIYRREKDQNLWLPNEKFPAMFGETSSEHGDTELHWDGIATKRYGHTVLTNLIPYLRRESGIELAEIGDYWRSLFLFWRLLDTPWRAKCFGCAEK